MPRTPSTWALFALALVATSCSSRGGDAQGAGGAAKGTGGAAQQGCADACAMAKAGCDAECKGDKGCSRSCAEVSQNCMKICSAHEKLR